MTTPVQVPNNIPGQQTINLATVEVGEVPATDNKAQYSDGGDPAGPYTDYQIQNRFEGDKHLYMLPISSPGGFAGASAAFVQLAAPTLLWICDWTAARFDVQPKAPNPTTQDPNWVLLDEHYEPFQITKAADGFTTLYRLTGTYVYGHKNPASAVITNVAFPQPPWLTPQTGRTIGTDIYQQGLSLPAAEMRMGPPRPPISPL